MSGEIRHRKGRGAVWVVWGQERGETAVSGRLAGNWGNLGRRATAVGVDVRASAAGAVAPAGGVAPEVDDAAIHAPAMAQDDVGAAVGANGRIGSHGRGGHGRAVGKVGLFHGVIIHED